jgi:O-antigen ligase
VSTLIRNVSPTGERWSAGLVIAVLAVAVGAGKLFAEGSVKAYALAGLVMLATLTLAISGRLFEVLVIWIAVEGLAFPFVRYPFGHNLITFDRVVVLAMGGALLLRSWPRMAKQTRFLAYALGAFAAAYGVRAFTTEQLMLPLGYLPSASYQPQLDWLDNALMPFIVFVVAARTLTAERWRIVAKALAFLGVTIAGFAFVQWIFGFEFATISGYAPFVDITAGVVRTGGPYPDPTAYGGVMLVCIAATLYWIQTEKAYALGIPAVLFEVAGLAPSYTKTVWGAALLTIILALGLRRRVSSRTVLVGVYVALVVGVLYSLVQDTSVIRDRVSSQGSADNFTGRVAAWRQGIVIFQHWPVQGAGIEQFVGAQQVVGPVYQDGVKAVPTPHNVFISVLGEMGLLGIVPLVLILVGAVLLVRAVRRRARTGEEVIFGSAVVAALAGLLLLSQTFSLNYEPPAFVFGALLLGAAGARLRSDRAPAAQPGGIPQAREPVGVSA